MTAIVNEHCKYVQDVYDNFSDNVKIQLRRYAPFDRIILKKIGVPSGLAAVYDIDGYGEWVAKINKIDDETKQIYAMNNTIINDTLRPHVNFINNTQGLAKIAVCDHKEFLPHKGIMVTFEKKMQGVTLQELLALPEFKSHPNQLDILKTIFNKIKATLEYLYNNTGFVHHDLHCGNVFIEYDYTPVIFDFDWAVFAKPEYLRSPIFLNMYGIVFANTFKELISEVYDGLYGQQQNQTYKIQPKSCQTASVLSWYVINAVYSVFANNYYSLQPNHPSIDHLNSMISKCDMTLLVYDFFRNYCPTQAIGRDAFNIENIDSIVTLNSQQNF